MRWRVPSLPLLTGWESSCRACWAATCRRRWLTRQLTCSSPGKGEGDDGWEVKLMKPRYQAADRAERSRILSEMEQVTKLHRKSLTRLLHEKSLARKKRQTPRARTYGVEVERANQWTKGCRWDVFPGTRKSLATLKWIWCTTEG